MYVCNDNETCSFCQGSDDAITVNLDSDDRGSLMCAACATKLEARAIRRTLGTVERESKSARAKADPRFREYLANSKARDIAASLLRSDLDEMGF